MFFSMLLNFGHFTASCPYKKDFYLKRAQRTRIRAGKRELLKVLIVEFIHKLIPPPLLPLNVIDYTGTAELL